MYFLNQNLSTRLVGKLQQAICIIRFWHLVEALEVSNCVSEC